MMKLGTPSINNPLFQLLPSCHPKFITNTTTFLSLPRVPPSSPSFISFARRRTNSSSLKNKRHKRKDTDNNHNNKEDDLEEDAFEALFKQLEEDLKKDEELLDDGEDEISEDELAMLERELEEALAEDESLSELLSLTTNVVENGDEVKEGFENEVVEHEVVENEEDEDEEEEEPIKLKGWQLKRLAYALKAGRRKTSIKNLAAELCLDRAIVLELLRDPPPSLLMMSASLPDKVAPPVAISEPEDIPSVSSVVEGITDVPEPEPEPKAKTPIHVMHDSWSAQKRLKKVQVETLENVYRRTKRPTNAMLSSIVHVTNLPRKRVVKWFEDKRADEGVPEQHSPYRRSSSETVFSK